MFGVWESLTIFLPQCKSWISGAWKSWTLPFLDPSVFTLVTNEGFVDYFELVTGSYSGGVHFEYAQPQVTTNNKEYSCVTNLTYDTTRRVSGGVQTLTTDDNQIPIKQGSLT